METDIKNLEIKKLTILPPLPPGKTFIVKIPDDATWEDVCKIREDLRAAIPETPFLMLRNLDIINPEEVPDIIDGIAQKLLQDESFLTKLAIELQERKKIK